MSWSEQVAVYLATADSVADLVERIDDYSAPGLGVWDLRGLTGHTLRALTALERYLDAAPVEGPLLPDAASYFARYLEERDRDPQALDRLVAERGVAEAATLGADAAATFREVRARLAPRLIGADPDLPTPTALDPMRLADYLRTRNLELVMHGLDIAAAIRTDWEPPRPALVDALRLLVESAIERGRGADLARTLGGRLAPEAVLPVLR